MKAIAMARQVKIKFLMSTDPHKIPRILCIQGASISDKPYLSTRLSNLNAILLGAFWPCSYFWTVEDLVLRYAANTAWLALFLLRICLICEGL